MAQRGRCVCGAVRFEVAGELSPPVACHCQYCRRAHGSVFSLGSLARSADFRVTAGEDRLRVWESPRGGQRLFCGDCGTRIANRDPDYPKAIVVIVGALDEELERGPAMHINLESKAPWYEIHDDAPRFDALPPGAVEALERIEKDGG